MKIAPVIAEHVMALRDATRTASASPTTVSVRLPFSWLAQKIESVSDLTVKIMAIDDRRSASDAKVHTAIAAAGAAEVQLSEGQAKAIHPAYAVLRNFFGGS